MWSTAAAVALLASITVVSANLVRVIVPSAPALHSEVVLQCDYRLDRGEHIEHMSWARNGLVFMTYRQQPEEYSYRAIRGLDVDKERSNSTHVILNNVADSASGNYRLSMTVATESGTSSFTHEQEMVVGGEVADTLGNRFGGGSNRRPSSSSGTTTITSSSSSSGSSGSFGGGLGNRFGGNRPTGGSSFAANAPPLAAAAPAAGTGLAGAQVELQNAVNQLNNIAAALG